MSDEMTSSPPPSNGRDDDLIQRARRQMEGVSGGEESLATLPGMPPPDTFPGYEIVREIHRGGQGAVYLAIQKTTRRKVAIKVMHGGPHVGSSGRARFEREVQILGQLNHPNIVRILDSGTTVDGGFFYVMDYVSGRTLEEHVAATKPPIIDVLRLFIKICDGANAAHLKGVIHRDLKPANVRVDARGEPVIVDFGLAKIAVPDVTQETRPQLMSITGQFIGSLPWASPEQAEGNPSLIDVRTDVYSLGVMLYQMLTGRFPYDVVGHMRDVLNNIARAAPARPSTVRRQINDEVETIVLKCLSKERERRYQSAGEIGRDISHYLAGEPIEAKRDSGWYVISKTLKRYRPQVGVAAAFVLLLVGWGATGWFQWNREHAWRRDAEEKGRALKSETEQKERALVDAAGKATALEREIERRKRINEFMDDVFKAATPEVAQGRDLTVVEAVDAAAANVEKRLGADEAVAAEVHGAIGEVYLRLMEPDKAKPHLEKAAELRKKLLGAADPQTLDAFNSLGLMYRARLRFEEAEVTLRMVVAECSGSSRLGPDHVKTLEARVNLARVLDVRDQAKKSEAEAIYGSLLDPLRRAPDRRVLLVVVLVSYAELVKVSDAPKADELSREAIDLVERNPDPAQGRLYGKTRLIRTEVLDKPGSDPAQTERAYRAAVEHYSRLMGETNIETLDVRSRLATFLRKQGGDRLVDAAAEWKKLADDVTAVHPDDKRVPMFRGRYGEVLMEMGRLEEAKPFLLASHDGFEKLKSDGLKIAKERLVTLYTRLNQPEEAAKYAQPAPGG